MRTRIWLWSCLPLALVVAYTAQAEPPAPAAAPVDPAAPAPPQEDSRMVLMGAMQQELDRAMARLRLPEYDVPYFIGYQLTQVEDFGVYAKYGAVFEQSGGRKRNLYVEVRVGDYTLDNTGSEGGFSYDPNQVDNPYVSSEAPLSDDAAALRQRLWLLTDDTYKEALSAFLRKRSEGVYAVDKKNKTTSFSRETPQTWTDPARPLSFDAAVWTGVATRLSGLLKRYPEIYDGEVTLSAQKVTRWYVNSEGARILTEQILYSFTASAQTRADDGMYLDNSTHSYYRTEAEIPTEAVLTQKVEAMVADLLALRKAPVLEPYTGPAILAPEATGVLFHESVGHRLEGERQNSDEEGQTFKGQMGSAILPPFLSIVDDPTLSMWGDVPLNGYYRFDEEGVPAQRTVLVDSGVLKTFLMSRTPVEGVSGSNGHGRSSGAYDPIARMGNFMVVSSNAVSDEELKRRLMEECRKQNKPYGLLIENIEGGSTNTSAYGYQAFKGSPRMVYKIDAATGEQTLVRGVEMVGTPLTVIGKVLVTSDKPEVFNGFCGAESGFVPVSTLAPAMLLSEIELQRNRTELGRLPILPSPDHEPPAPPPARPEGKKKGKR